ncbi:uncharacterized protein B0H18DRAFT_1165258 [Fomitopsis serialis]|uniref:uncharacterized protein n=1 Tax=Fomitopsis serialis TaxID=139415 RepID=UPI00200880F0|nr:uncharacterized protein B0H18DRAFT_1165258 [Neoantrodia serialis]KAH9936627.1 hypothetical protein B0H18DRAFT_1165258 [Neoantrodia serialis]
MPEVDNNSSGSGSQPPSPTPASGYFRSLSPPSPDVDHFDTAADSPGGWPEPTEYAGTSEPSSPLPDFDDRESVPRFCTFPIPGSFVGTPPPSPEHQAVGQRVLEGSPGPVTPDKQSQSFKFEFKTTPVAKKPSNSQPNSVGSIQGREHLESLRGDYAADMEDKTAQVSLDVFMREFVPGPDPPPDLTVEAFDPAKFQRQEQAMYGELCKVANSVFSHVPVQAESQRLVAKDTHRWSDPTDEYDFEENMRPDVMFYPSHDDAQRAFAIKSTTTANDEGPEEKALRKNRARTAWLWATLCIEAKADDGHSPFVIPDSMKETKSEKKTEAKKKRSGRKTAAQPATNPDTLVSSTSQTSQAPSMSASATAGPSTAPQTPSTPSLAPSLMQASATASSAQYTSPPFLRLNTKDGAQTMGQMAHYVSKILRRQFLVFFFTIFTCRDLAWLLRWDRAGLVVSEPFNFVQQPHLMHSFLYRFACMDDVRRGCDPTVKRATETEAKPMRSYDKFDSATDWLKVEFTATMRPDWPIYKISVPEEDMVSAAELEDGKKAAKDASKSASGRVREFLVGAPYFMNSSVTGRATRCHIAYDVAEQRLVFCKEYWRVDTLTSHPEGAVYLRLHSKGVRYIATPIAAGDVRHEGGSTHQTRSQEFIAKPGPKLVQYRLFLREIGQPLRDYEDSLHLVEILYYCLQAHEDAWLLAGILHRDISAENLLIYWYMENNELKCKALLVDWGLCKYLEEMEQPIVRKSRSGTWQFISAVLLVYPGTFPHEVWHDLESFIHVLHWMCLRFQNTDYSENPVRLRRLVSSIYESSEGAVRGISTGGFEKMKLMQEGRVPFALVGGSAGERSPGLHTLLLKLAALYKEHYRWFKPKLPASASASAKSQTAKAPQSRRRQIPLPTRIATSIWHPKGATTEEEPAKAVLRTHTNILMAFEEGLSDMAAWIIDEKTEDQFAYENSYLEQQKKKSREASRRISEEETSVEDKPRKHGRSDTNAMPTSSASQMGSIAEIIEG